MAPLEATRRHLSLHPSKASDGGSHSKLVLFALPSVAGWVQVHNGVALAQALSDANDCMAAAATVAATAAATAAVTAAATAAVTAAARHRDAANSPSGTFLVACVHLASSLHMAHACTAQRAHSRCCSSSRAAGSSAEHSPSLS